jgi:hypothetical protein
VTQGYSPIPNTQAQSSIKSFTCPQCSGTIALRAVGLSITAVCEHCSSLIDVANENFRVIKEAQERARVISIPLGTRGKLHGDEWEVIGYMERGDESAIYTWREYLLFNPWQGFRFLVESDGHWNFVTLLRVSIEPWFNSLRLNGKSYVRFSTINAKVLYVMGEFYWRVKVGDTAFLTDYIAPPSMLSSERTADEITWSQGTYLSLQEIQTAFGILPRPHGVAANQPNPYAARFGSHLKLCAIMSILLLLGQCAIAGKSANQTVLEQPYQMSPQDNGKPIIIGPLELTSGTTNVELFTQSPVQNNWLELEADLVNTQTQEQFSLNQTIEYYSGYDSDGYWSEGSQSQSAMATHVPSGRYQLVVTPNSGTAASAPLLANSLINYQLTLKRDVPIWSNFWISFVMFLLLPLYLLWRKSAFERTRWEESDISASPSSPRPMTTHELNARQSILSKDDITIPKDGE